MKTFKFFIIISIIILNNSCSSVGSKTLYSNNSIAVEVPKNIGFSQLQNQQIIDKIVQGTADLYERTMNSELEKRNIKSTKIEYQNFENWESLKKAHIAEICKSRNLDGIIFSKLYFLNTQYKLVLIPIGKSQDTEVEMQYFNSNGDLIFYTKHNTMMGNSYFNFPSADKTVPDGTKGALNKMFKEFQRS